MAFDTSASGAPATADRSPDLPPDHPRGTWFDPTARRLVPQADLFRSAAGKAALLLGETHDRAEIHRWQLHVITALHAMGVQLAVGFEMFPRSVQSVLDRWVDGELAVEAFLDQADWARHWGFDAELYLPILHFCRQARLPMIGLNCYRALVSRVRREGWDAIPVAERDGLSPAAPATPEYRQYLLDILNRLRDGGPPRVMDARFDGFVAAQQVWDRAFAENIVAARTRHPGHLIVGIIGRGHLEFGHGTPYQLRDLGIDDVAIFLTREAVSPREARAADEPVPGIADAVFCLDAVEAPRPRPPRLGMVVDEGERGVIVSAVDDDSPAAAAGLRRGDVLRRVCREPVDDKGQVLSLLRRLPHGVSVPIEVERAGATISLLACLPPPPGASRPGRT